jgi:WD40 repeat protein
MEILQVKEHPGSGVGRLVVSPDGKTLASQEIDDRYPAIHLWDLATGRKLRELPVQRYGSTFAFSPDSTVLAATGVLSKVPGMRRESDAVQLWEVQTGKELRQFGKQSWLFGERSMTIYAVAFSPDGRP